MASILLGILAVLAFLTLMEMLVGRATFLPQVRLMVLRLIPEWRPTLLTFTPAAQVAAHRAAVERDRQFKLELIKRVRH